MKILDPGKELSTDESMVKFKGRLLPSKKSAKLESKSGVWQIPMLQFSIYTDKDRGK